MYLDIQKFNEMSSNSINCVHLIEYEIYLVMNINIEEEFKLKNYFSEI